MPAASVDLRIENEVKIERVISAPRELVFRAWTEPEHVRAWFVLDGTATEYPEIDVREGGRWVMRLSLPDGSVCTAEREYEDIVAPSRIVFYERCNQDGKVILDGTHIVDLEEVDAGHTRVTVRCVFTPDFAREQVEDWNVGWSGGWGEGITRLEAHVQDVARHHAVVITRLFDATPEALYRAFTDPIALAAWWGPAGFRNTVALDVRVGGSYRIVMHAPDGTDYPITGTYLDVSPPTRLQLTEVLDEHPAAFHQAVATHSGGARALPAVLTVTIAPDGARTRLTLHTAFASDALRDAMVKMGMYAGWGESLARLARHMKP